MLRCRKQLLFILVSMVPAASSYLFHFHQHLLSGNRVIFDLRKSSQPPRARSGRRNHQRPDFRMGTTKLQNPFSFLFPQTTSKSDDDSSIVQERRQKKNKRALLEACSNPNIPPTQRRSRVEAAMEALRDCSPVLATASSALLRKKWKLIWTTEKEINFFLDRGWAEEITQTIKGNRLQNNIPFVGGGGFGVQGTLNIPDPLGQRTEFRFTSASLDLRPRWGKWDVPPIGRGWFDTIYLDEDLRVDINSRNDILICEPHPVA